MYKSILVLVLIVIIGCNSRESNSNNQIKLVDSRKSADSLMALGDRPDSEQESPSQAEERERLSKTYENTEIIDTVFSDGLTQFHLRVKYYCLKKQNLIIPKIYDVKEKNKSNFFTHPFTSDVILTKNGDTLLNKQFKATTFEPFYRDDFGGNLKKYGNILKPELSKVNHIKGRFLLNYSLSIPTTDIGIPVKLMIDEKRQL